LDIDVPRAIAFEASFKPGWQLDVTLPVVTLEALLARPWKLDVVLPKADFEALFVPRISWSLDVTLPVIYFEGSYYALDLTNNVAFCLNPANRAHADYTNYGFTSFCKFNGEYLGTDAAGISRLSGDDDDTDPINSRVLFGVVDDGSSVLSRVDSAFFNLRHDGAINALMKYEEQEEDYFEVDYDSAIDPPGIHTRRAKFSRGVEGRNLQAGFENVSGADFEITEIEVITVPLSRHEK
jgi:hypothetical protein